MKTEEEEGAKRIEDSANQKGKERRKGQSKKGWQYQARNKDLHYNVIGKGPCQTKFLVKSHRV